MTSVLFSSHSVFRVEASSLHSFFLLGLSAPATGLRLPERPNSGYDPVFVEFDIL
jgi:hypothetical protein